ncbi:hypothetical protein [Caenimonas sp. SL110]|uniref:hypothetical protein n=1 Tax=Caenimonas sp. SL110 TaxID=1450524 RepID=UPI000653FEC8|nr:hypothetical protein [Caenimonas sp. SL110]
MTARLRLSDLVGAFEWVSVDGPFENLAYVSRASGEIWLVSDFDDAGAEPPEDADDETSYLTVPSKRELDLGRSLALRFAEEFIPNDLGAVREFFSRRGAYARFKDLLEQRGALDAWFAYEVAGVQQALRAWALENDIELVEEAA